MGRDLFDLQFRHGRGTGCGPLHRIASEHHGAILNQRVPFLPTSRILSVMPPVRRGIDA